MEVNAEELEAPLDLTAVQWDHQNYRFLLEARGIDVLSLRDALTNGAIDAVGEPEEGPPLDRLRSVAAEALDYRFAPGVSEARRRVLLERRDRIIERAHPEVLADLLLLRPLVKVGFDGDPAMMEYTVRPALAAHFVRDALIATAAGAVMGRASNPARRWENRLMSLAMKQLGTRPVAEVVEPGFLEGGDFIPGGDFALLRVGPSSNREAFEQILRAGAFGVPEVALVRDGDTSLVHLDDYLVFVGPGHAVVHEDRLEASGEPVVEIYDASEVRTEGPSREVGFREYLAEKGKEVVAARPESPYTLSGLMVLGPNEVVVAAGVGDSPTVALREMGVDVQVLELEAAGGRGGLRGLTQVLRRGEDKADTRSEERAWNSRFGI